MNSRTISLVGILGAIVAIIAICGGIMLRANDQGTATGFLAIVGPTIVALLGLLKTEMVQNDVQGVRDAQAQTSAELHELTNGKMHAAVHEAVAAAIEPVAEKLDKVVPNDSP